MDRKNMKGYVGVHNIYRGEKCKQIIKHTARNKRDICLAKESIQHLYLKSQVKYSSADFAIKVSYITWQESQYPCLFVTWTPFYKVTLATFVQSAKAIYIKIYKQIFQGFLWFQSC